MMHVEGYENLNINLYITSECQVAEKFLVGMVWYGLLFPSNPKAGCNSNSTCPGVGEANNQD